MHHKMFTGILGHHLFFLFFTSLKRLRLSNGVLGLTTNPPGESNLIFFILRNWGRVFFMGERYHSA